MIFTPVFKPWNQLNSPSLAGVISRTMRICTNCKCMKPKTKEFFRFKRTTGYFSSRCIWCEQRQERAFYHRNREEILARKSAMNALDPSKAAKRRRSYYVRNKDRVNAGIARRVQSSPTLRLRAAMRSRFHAALTGFKGGRSWQELVGYTVHELRRHIEALLPPEWTWENYGTAWVVDHKRPVASFDLPRQVKECWALSNLQPLEKMENHRKGAKFTGDIV